MPQRLASLSVDVDTPDVLFPDSYKFDAALFTRTIDRFREVFDQYQVKATFFMVGKTAKFPAVQKAIQLLHREGHEIASHSHNHHQGIRSLSPTEKRHEITESKNILSDLTGEKIQGFRAPGWNVDKELLTLLKDTGYEYDSSVFPTSALPALKVYYGLTASKDNGASDTLGEWANLFSSRRVHTRQGIREIPISVTPGLRLPFTGTFASLLGDHYFRLGMRWLEKSKVPFLNFNLHFVELMEPATGPLPSGYVPAPFKTALAPRLAEYHFWLTEISRLHHFVPLRDLKESDHGHHRAA